MLTPKPLEANHKATVYDQAIKDRVLRKRLGVGGKLCESDIWCEYTTRTCRSID